ncbi:MAG TPA: ABC transporter substrate-binding protein [Pseudolysinimonas sp.]|nr:ABC transporter substrate-binding protein [Pseudolysinimonas sp.]
MLARRLTAALATGAITLLLAACVPADAGSDPNNPRQLELFTSWTTPTERAGLDALLAVYAKRDPGIQIFDASVAVGTGGTAQTALEARLKAGNPPDTFQAPAGAAITDLVDGGRLDDLSQLVDRTGLADALPLALRESVTSDAGLIHSVPIGVHRANLVWANYDVLSAAGLDPAARAGSIDEWLGQLKLLRAAGVEYPLALGTEWTQLLLFENVLLSDLGADTYAGLWTGATRWDGTFVKTAVDDYAALVGYVDPGFRSLDGDAAAGLVADGSAAFVVLPDTALATFKVAGLDYGTDYAGLPTPGTRGVFDLLADSFTLPVGATHQDAATTWLETVASPEGQLAFAVATGAIPARTDVDVTTLSTFQRTAASSLTSDQLVPSVTFGAAARPAWVNALTKAITRYSDDRKAGALVAALRETAQFVPER